jgi:hypothetical protein
VGQHQVFQRIKDTKLDGGGAVSCAGDLGFQRTELRRGETHGTLHGLPVNKKAIQRRLHEAFTIFLGHLDKVTEKVVVLDAQGAGVGFLGVSHLQACDDAPRIVPQGSHLFQVRKMAASYEAAVALLQRQVIGQGQ